MTANEANQIKLNADKKFEENADITHILDKIREKSEKGANCIRAEHLDLSPAQRKALEDLGYKFCKRGMDYGVWEYLCWGEPAEFMNTLQYRYFGWAINNPYLNEA